MDWEKNLALWERLAAASRDAADSAPHGSIYHIEAAKFLAMCQALEDFAQETQHEQEAAPAQDAAEAGAGAGEAAPAAAGEAEAEETTPETPKPRGRRR
jgi:hypothetical protein